MKQKRTNMQLLANTLKFNSDMSNVSGTAEVSLSQEDWQACFLRGHCNLDDAGRDAIIDFLNDNQALPRDARITEISCKAATLRSLRVTVEDYELPLEDDPPVLSDDGYDEED